MNRLGLKLSGPNLQILTLAALTITLTAMFTGHDTPRVLSSAAAALLFIGVLTYRSRTLIGWIWHRLTYRRTRRVNNHLYRHKQAGVTWDGQRASAYIEILPAPYEETLVDGPSISPQRTIPIDDIREELTQFDIHCHHITVYTIGYKYETDSNPASILHAAVGPTDALFYGRTIVEVSVELAQAIDSLSARKGSGTDAEGLNNTVVIAAERIRRRISAAGRPAQLLSDTELAALDTSLRKILVPALLDEHWASTGHRTMATASYTPEPSAWTADRYREWCRTNPHRQIHALRLTPHGNGDHAEIYVTQLVTDATALTTVGALGLRTEYGQQGDILTAYLPSVRTAKLTAIPGRTLPRHTRFPVPFAPAGIGTYLGHTKTRARLFVNFTTGTAPFYIIGPATLCQQLLLRLATSGRSIDIAIDTDPWRLFAQRIDATNTTNPDADIVLAADHPPVQMHPGQVRLVWTTNAANLPHRPDYAIVAGPEECALYTPQGVTRYQWSTTTAEQAFYTFTQASPTPAPAAASTPQPTTVTAPEQHHPPPATTSSATEPRAVPARTVPSPNNPIPAAAPTRTATGEPLS